MNLDYKIFRKQLAYFLEQFLEKNILDKQEHDVTEIAIKYLRTDKFDITSADERGVVQKMDEKYIDTIESTILKVSKLN